MTKLKNNPGLLDRIADLKRQIAKVRGQSVAAKSERRICRAEIKMMQRVVETGQLPSEWK